MKLGFQGNNNGKLVSTADNLKFACQELGIPDDAHTLRRTARAFDLYYSDKVEHVSDHTFKVASQYDRQEPYQVLIKPTKHLKAGCYAYCTCEDWMNYSGDMDVPDVNFWCKHSIASLIWLHNNNGNGNGSKVVTECGTEETKQLQDELNRQSSDSQGNNRNGASKAPSQAMPLNLNDPFQESEQLDIEQLEGRRDGDLVWRLRNGEYVISYKGIMSLAEKHHITFDEAVQSDTYTVIVKGRCGTSERCSAKLINGNVETAMELAKRNAARQLLPYAELKAVEHKAKLNAEFNWQKARRACLKLLPEHCINLIIRDLVQEGKLRQASPSEYNRLEWRLIYETCKKEEAQPDPKSVGNWSYNSPVVIDKCREAIAKVREEKKLRKPVEQIFCRSNDTTKKLSKLYDEKPIEFEVDTTKPNVVKLIFSNGTVAKVYDQVIYESVLRA